MLFHNMLNIKSILTPVSCSHEICCLFITFVHHLLPMEYVTVKNSFHNVEYIVVLEIDQLGMDHCFLCYLLTKCIKLTQLSGHTHPCVQFTAILCHLIM